MSEIQNIALLIEYAGDRFSGFQKQSDPQIRTIQTELETALTKFSNEIIQITVAGRTDAHVHALNQVINFTTSANRNPYSWVRGINALLPDDIRVKQSVIAPLNFNARFNALSRTYCFYLKTSEVKPAILHGKVGWYHGDLDLSKMKEACTKLAGRHDFSSFRAANCQASTPIRDMKECEIIKYDEIIRFKFRANAFLYHMVRNLVGALIYVGNGKISVKEFEQLLSFADRTKAPPTFMPEGLYLTDIEYDPPLFNYSRIDWLGFKI